MNIEHKKEYLELYLIQHTKIRRLYEQIKKSPRAVFRYRRQIRKAERLRRKIEDRIDAVDGGILSEILSQRFLCGRTLEETAIILNYSKRHTERLYIRALEKIKI